MRAVLQQVNITGQVEFFDKPYALSPPSNSSSKVMFLVVRINATLNSRGHCVSIQQTGKLPLPVGVCVCVCVCVCVHAFVCFSSAVFFPHELPGPGALAGVES